MNGNQTGRTHLIIAHLLLSVARFSIEVANIEIMNCQKHKKIYGIIGPRDPRSRVVNLRNFRTAPDPDQRFVKFSDRVVDP